MTANRAMTSRRPQRRSRQRGWAGLIVLLLALLIVGFLAKDALSNTVSPEAPSSARQQGRTGGGRTGRASRQRRIHPVRDADPARARRRRIRADAIRREQAEDRRRGEMSEPTPRGNAAGRTAPADVARRPPAISGGKATGIECAAPARKPDIEIDRIVVLRFALVLVVLAFLYLIVWIGTRAFGDGARQRRRSIASSSMRRRLRAAAPRPIPRSRDCLRSACASRTDRRDGTG